MGISTRHQHERLLTLALLASIALHLIIAYFIPALASIEGEGPAIETISFVHIIRLSSVMPRPVTHEHVAAAQERAPVPHVTAAKPVSNPHAARRSLKHETAQQRSTAPIVAAPRSGSAVEAVAASAPPVSATPPQQEQVASMESRRDTGGYLPLGAEQPDPVLDPTVLKNLAGLNVHVTLVITVDETGHTKTIVFQPPLDATIENQIRSMLASATWDPAVCGAGVPCEGHTTIKL